MSKTFHSRVFWPDVLIWFLIQKSIKHTVRDFIFIHFLQDLIASSHGPEGSRLVVAPMLPSTGLYSNFWAGNVVFRPIQEVLLLLGHDSNLRAC